MCDLLHSEYVRAWSDYPLFKKHLNWKETVDIINGVMLILNWKCHTSFYLSHNHFW
jgi:hypothetical protein